MAYEGRYSIWNFTWGDEQDGGTWWHDLAGTTSTYVGDDKRTTTVGWGEFRDLSIRGTIKQATERKNSISHSETTIWTVFKSYMIAKHKEFKEPAVRMRMQFEQRLYKDVGVGKKTKTTWDVLKEAKTSLDLDNKPITVSNVEHQIAKDAFMDLKRTRSEIPSYVELETVDSFLIRPSDKLSRKKEIKNSKLFVKGLLARLMKAVYHTPKECTRWSDRDKALFTFGTLTLSATTYRKRDDGMFGLVLMGAAAVGKSSAFVDNGQLARIATDAEGVGRFRVPEAKTTLLSEEWSVDLLIDKSNFNTIKQIAAGALTSVKVHSTFTTLPSLWYGLTTNDTYEELEAKTSHLTLTNKCALRRRFMWLEWEEELEMDMKIIRTKNNKLTRALMVVELLKLLRDNPDSVLSTFEPINVYIRAIYEDAYSKAKDLLLEYGIDHTELVLTFKDHDDTTDSEGESEPDRIPIRSPNMAPSLSVAEIQENPAVDPESEPDGIPIRSPNMAPSTSSTIGDDGCTPS